jgi:alkaline phosphatase D
LLTTSGVAELAGGARRESSLDTVCTTVDSIYKECVMEPEGLVENGQRVRRREFLIAGAASGLAVAGPVNYAALARARRLPVADGGSFAHGVSSGFPSSSEITLWTRVSELGRSSKIGLEVATDPTFRHVVCTQQPLADAGKDFTVHARVSGLRPAHEYHYRFHTKHKSSRVGMFRTLPPPDSNHAIRIGFYSCSSYEAGYFTALAGLAREKDLDLILCLGDYIYEHHYYNGPAARRDRTGRNRDGDVQTLAEYRQKYRFYQSDKDLQDMHAAHPFVVIWDDHEVEDNYPGTGPDSKQPNPALENSGYARRVPFRQRRKNAYRAFFEAMPRIPLRSDPDRIYGTIRLGKMAELFLTDERQYRDPQPCADVQLTPCPSDLAPGRTFLGSKQKSWLKRAVSTSRARWNLLASETMMMALDSAPGVHVNQDQWDGYSAEREEILSHFHASGVKNLVVLSGDLHTFVAGNLTTTGEQSGTPVGVELLGGSATSFGLPEEVGIPAKTLDALRKAADPHVIFADFESKGYCVITVTRNEVVGEFKTTNTKQPHSRPSSLAKFKVESGTPKLHQL